MEQTTTYQIPDNPLVKEMFAYAEDLRDTVPAYRKVNNLNPVGMSGISAIFYEGMPYNNLAKTEIFAYIGLPEGASAQNPVPAVVCLHGGGGKAYPQWVEYWTSRGYAAIAMDLYGEAPTSAETNPYTTDYTSRHAKSGPRSDSMRNSALPLTEQWMFHSVTAAILAENLLRSFDEVKDDCIGITGISWGSHITMNTISYDQRFAFAVPVYGSASLPDSEGLFGMNFSVPESRLLWDPTERLAAYNKVPTMLLNGDSDPHFSVKTTQNSYEAIPNTSILIKHEYAHGHTQGWSKLEIYAFADSICKGGKPLATISAPEGKGEQSLAVTLPEGARMSATATVFYMTTKELPYDLTVSSSSQAWKGTWSSLKATASGNTITFTVPDSATRYFAEITYTLDGRRYSVSTCLAELT